MQPDKTDRMCSCVEYVPDSEPEPQVVNAPIRHQQGCAKLYGKNCNCGEDDTNTGEDEPETQMFTNALYLHPAPALPADLKAELIECLKMGLAAQMYVHWIERKSPNFIKEICFERQDKIQAAIKELEAMPTTEEV